MYSDLAWYYGSRRKLRVGTTSAFERLESRTLMSISPISAALLQNADTSAAVVVQAAHAAPAVATPALAQGAMVLGRAWQSTSVTNPGTAYELSFDVVASQQGSESGVGLSNGTATRFADIAAGLVFRANNRLVVRNGGAYDADTQMTYTAGTTYHVRFDVNPSAQTYSVYVAPAGGTEVALAQDYSFRSGSFDGTTLDSVSGFSGAGAPAVSNVAVNAIATPAAKNKGKGSSGATGEPGAGNTGPTNTSILKKSASIFVYTPNTVISNVAVTGSIYIMAPNCKITNFTIDAAGGRYGIEVKSGGSVTATDGEIINANVAAVEGNNWTANRLNVHNLGSDAFNGGGNNLLENSWIHQIGSLSGAHADGFQAVNGQNMVIQGNNFDIPWRSQVGSTVYKVNSCIFLNGSLYGAQYLTGTILSGNWFNGGNYSIYGMAQVGTKVTNNVFGVDSQWGDKYGTFASWTGNTDA